MEKLLIALEESLATSYDLVSKMTIALEYPDRHDDYTSKLSAIYAHLEAIARIQSSVSTNLRTVLRIENEQ